MFKVKRHIYYLNISFILFITIRKLIFHMIWCTCISIPTSEIAVADPWWKNHSQYVDSNFCQLSLNPISNSRALCNTGIEELTPMLLVANLANKKQCLKPLKKRLKRWHLVLIWEYSVRASQWIWTWQGFAGFQKSFASFCFGQSSLCIGRVNVPVGSLVAGWQHSGNPGWQQNCQVCSGCEHHICTCNSASARKTREWMNKWINLH